ncbi:preprotein translocase subunit SecE [Patescibacteria group bacterium]|nr:preprotein translocase subunit SecE [Patescibacteria group bacterium]
MKDFTITAPDFGKNPVVFIKEVRSELAKVAWPTRPEVVRLTGVVIGVSIIVGVYLGGLDYVFTRLIELLLKQ